MIAKREKSNEALNKAAEETMEIDEFEHVSEGSSRWSHDRSETL